MQNSKIKFPNIDFRLSNHFDCFGGSKILKQKHLGEHKSSSLNIQSKKACSIDAYQQHFDRLINEVSFTQLPPQQLINMFTGINQITRRVRQGKQKCEISIINPLQFENSINRKKFLRIQKRNNNLLRNSSPQPYIQDLKEKQILKASSQQGTHKTHYQLFNRTTPQMNKSKVVLNPKYKREIYYFKQACKSNKSFY